MYTPLGKINKKPVSTDNTNPLAEFVPLTEYDRVKKDDKAYDLRTTITLPKYEGGPTESQYEQGSYVRMFAQHKQTGQVLELSKENYLQLRNQTAVYHYPSYFIGSIQWRLRGPVANQDINGYIIQGAQEDNEYFISELEKVLPNIRKYLTDPTQFVK